MLVGDWMRGVLEVRAHQARFEKSVVPDASE